MPAVRLSRYEFAASEVDEFGRKFLDVPDPIPRRTFVDDDLPKVGQGDDLFTLAWTAYRSALDREQDVRPSGFFWVVAQANDIVDAAAPLAVGSRLRVHSVETLFGEILVPPPFFDQGDEEVPSP